MTTAERLKPLLDANPNQTLQELGDLLGISRERVRQLCVKHGWHRIQCWYRNSAHGQRRRTGAYCLECQKYLGHRNKTGYCRTCITALNLRQRIYCKNGHTLADTAFRRPDGNRRCRPCWNEYALRYYHLKTKPKRLAKKFISLALYIYALQIERLYSQQAEIEQSRRNNMEQTQASPRFSAKVERNSRGVTWSVHAYGDTADECQRLLDEMVADMEAKYGKLILEKEATA